MSSIVIPAALRIEVIERARFCCEYCLLPENASFYSHEIDHIVAVKHRGLTVPQNLAYACWRCNRHKGTDLASLDPDTSQIALLFHPRNDRWNEHFRWEYGRLVGISPTGNATAELLQFNRPDRLAERIRVANVIRNIHGFAE